MSDLKKVYPVNTFEEKTIEMWIDDETGEVIDEDIAKKDFLEKAKSSSFQQSIINKIKIEDAYDDVIAAEIANLSKLRKIRQNRVKNFKKFLAYIMELNGVDKIDFGKTGAKIKKNPPALVIGDYSKLGDYTKVEMVDKIDKEAIKNDIKAGKKVPGCKLESSKRVDIF